MADPRDQGSKLGQLYGNGGGSKIDQLYGSPSKDDATKAAEMERRVEQKMYRDAVRNKDYRAVATFHAKPGFQAVGGITRHGQFDAQDKKTGENFTQEGNRLYNNGQQGANEIERAAKPLGTGAGDKPENSTGGSSGGEWANVGPSATGGAATALSPSTAPAIAKPADWRQERQTALDAARKEIDSKYATPPKEASESVAPKGEESELIKSLNRFEASTAKKREQGAANSKRDQGVIDSAQKAVSDASKVQQDFKDIELRGNERDISRMEKEVRFNEAFIQARKNKAKDMEVWDSDQAKNAKQNNRIFTTEGQRETLPMPGINVDALWNSLDSKDPNLGQSRYQSQYVTKEVKTGGENSQNPMSSNTSPERTYQQEVFAGGYRPKPTPAETKLAYGRLANDPTVPQSALTPFMPTPMNRKWIREAKEEAAAMWP